MKKQFQWLFALVFTGMIILIGFRIPGDDKSRIAAEMEASIQTELLNKWYPLSMDTEHGGFLSTFSYDFKPVGRQEKMIVTQARHVWSNAKAAELYPAIAHYKRGARHGFQFLRDAMWDKQYGGFYTLVDVQGNLLQTDMGIKNAYGNAFGIFACAAYYQSSGDTAGLNLGKKAFLWLETHSHDPLNKGYFQHLQRDGTPVKRTAATPATAETGYKDQNSSIHLLEAFTELYKVWPDELLRQRLQEMLLLIRDRMIKRESYLMLFFQPDWTPVSVRDSSRDVILKHHNLDYISYGHNIETAYLLLEAAEAIGLKNDSITLRIAKKMDDFALRYGWDNQVGGFYDEGFWFKGSDSIAVLRDSKNWWAQAEGLNSLLMMADYFPDDTMQYFQKFKTQWKYVQTYLIDHQYGDWYAGGLDKEPQLKTAFKGQIWKGTYHVFRALANCVERLRPDKIAPSIPTNPAIIWKNKMPTLKWDSSTDNRILLGYNIYASDKRIGFTPLTFFSLTDFNLPKGSEIYVRAVDFQGNESAPGKKAVL